VTQRLKHVAVVIAGQSPESDQVTDLASGVPFMQGNAEFGEVHPLPVHECEAPPKIALAGDVLISVRAPVGAINVADQRYGIGRGLAAVRATSVHPGFLRWWLESSVPALRSLATGSTFDAISASDLEDLRLPVSDRARQRVISDFLDRETAQIDALVAEQRELVRLLEERRRVVIDQAVRTGLRGAPPTQDTGIPWIGSIPEHWEAQRIGNLARALIGLTYDPADIVDGEDAGTLVLRSGNIQGGSITHDDCVYVSSAIPAKLRLRQGDLLICSRNGSARLIGKNALVGSEDVNNTWGAFMSVLRSSLNPYLRWVLNSSIFAQQLGLFATSTINQLTTGALHSMRVPLPPRDEREEIVHHLETATAQTDAMIAAANESIALMLERRAALISAAVIGRIDPRTGKEIKEAS
jgi:type I restriction enzyme S subunit